MNLATLDGDEPRAVLLFGEGLIGGAIRHELEGTYGFRLTRFPFNWECESDAGALSRIEDGLEEWVDRIGTTATVSWIWAAGRAGFLATESQLAAEFVRYQEVLNWVQRLDSKKFHRLDAHLMSSAGGLFEGMRCIGERSAPDPRRPYGRTKLEQERLLTEAGGFSAIRIYRASSVVGLPRKGGRRGLIPTMVYNGLRHSETLVFGTPDSLRDYVWVGDVAEFVAKDVTQGSVRGASPTLLASGISFSILSIKARIERLLLRRLLVRYAAPGDELNAADITFAPSSHPSGWRPRNLDECIGRTMIGLVGQSTT